MTGTVEQVETDCQGYRQFMNVIYGQVGTLTKLILPPSASPKPSDASGFHFQETPTTTASKSRHSSISLMTPLNAVLEEAPSDVSALSNGSALEAAHHLESKAKMTTTIATNNRAKESVMVKSNSIEPIQQEREQPTQQMQNSSSCVIS